MFVAISGPGVSLQCVLSPSWPRAGNLPIMHINFDRILSVMYQATAISQFFSIYFFKSELIVVTNVSKILYVYEAKDISI